jgi:hypothetical protein
VKSLRRSLVESGGFGKSITEAAVVTYRHSD